MIAALQMYDWPEFQAGTDAFWLRVAEYLTQNGLQAPDALSRPDDLAKPWVSDDLLLGQTCGLPYVAGRCGRAVLVARPDYGLPDARDGSYASVLVARKNGPDTLADFADLTAAVNELGSQSGCNALADAVLEAGCALPFFGDVALSGGHRMSATMVAEGIADIAAIDAVSWALYQRAEPSRFDRLKIIGRTRVTPSLPFITAPANQEMRPRLVEALRHACGGSEDPGLPVRVQPAEDADYAPIREMAARVRGKQLARGFHPL